VSESLPLRFLAENLTLAVLSGRGVYRVGKKEMSARDLHFIPFIYFCNC
jgi:hypothetical protein